MNGAAYPRAKILGVILAGGRARRFGGQNKALLQLNGRPLVDHVFERLAPQCLKIVISANDDEAAYAHLTAPVVADTRGNHAGPIAGILAAMEWAVNTPAPVEWILSAPVDCPFLPDDFGAKLWHAACAAQTPAALSTSGARTHFVCGLWRISLHDQLRSLLETDRISRAETVAQSCGFATARWDTKPVDPFFNINTQEDLAAAEAVLPT